MLPIFSPPLLSPPVRHWLAALATLLLLVAASARWHLRAAPTAQALAANLGQLQLEGAAGPDGLQTAWLPVDAIQPRVQGRLRLGVLAPAGVPLADVLFLHGHADRLDNHRALFAAWQGAGMRVIALDWPSHGLSQVGPLDIYDGDDLIALVRQVERATLQDAARPLLLAGWSYGGLIATRLAQQPAALQGLSRHPAGLLLLAPGVAVLPWVGGDGVPRVETLMHAPYAELAGPPSPVSPLLNPVFAVRTLVQAWQARQAALPRDMPVQMVVADAAEDWYVDTDASVAWARRQQALGVPLQLQQCPGARHALDNEPWPIGARVRALAVDFARRAVGQVGAQGGPAGAAAASPVPPVRERQLALEQAACQLLPLEPPGTAAVAYRIPAP